MQTKTMLITAIKRAAYNPRVPLEPGSAEYERIKASLTEFGLVEPLVWNQRSGNLVGGHQRLTVLEAMGETRVAVSVVDLDDDHERALNVALNNVTGIWDMAALTALLKPLSDDLVALTGFNLSDLRAAGGWQGDWDAPLKGGDGEDDGEDEDAQRWGTVRVRFHVEDEDAVRDAIIAALAGFNGAALA